MAELTTDSCCTPAEQDSCCEAGDKDACCATTAAAGNTCGCSAGGRSHDGARDAVREAGAAS